MTDRMTEILQSGRAAVITGAAKGIGAAMARELSSRGIRLALLDRDGDALAAIVAECGKDTLSVCGDASSQADLQRSRDRAMEAFGNVALLVNNAGVMDEAGPWDDPADWQPILDVNLGSVLAAQHLFVPDMIDANRTAAIVNLAPRKASRHRPATLPIPWPRPG